MPKSVSQRNFLKGLSATESIWSQPPRIIPRVSNLLLNTRGALRTCDGSLIISQLNGVLQASTGPWTEINLFQPVNVNRYYVGIKKDPTTQLAAPVGVAVVDGGAGGALAAATYFYEVTALDGAGGETGPSSEVNIVNPGNHLNNLSWTAVTNATGYNVYRSTSSTTEVFLTKVTTNSFSDNGSITPGIATPPSINTTQQCLLYQIPATSYGPANVIATLPADLIIATDGTPGGGGGGGGGPSFGGGGSGGNAPNPSGGVSGNVSPIPQLVQFANKDVAALGNGLVPQLVTDNSPATPTATALTNTFVAAYPDWTASITFAVGDIIMPTAGNAGNFVFQAVQAGVTGAAHPTWPQTPNQRVQETAQKLIWLNTGATNTAPAPRGAAHAIVYAGSLWLYNTSPTTTADNFDGPSCLKMSDINNPTSFNPINTAFLGKDDGDVGTGLATFSIAAQGITPTGSLVVFKNFKTYQVIGVFGASDFSIQEAQTDMGCIAARSIQFLPGFGIARLTHLGFAIFDGVNDRLISEQIRPYLFGGVGDISTIDWNYIYFSKGAQSANPPMYMCATPIALTNLPIANFTVTGIVGAGLAKGTYFYRLTRFTLKSGVLTESDITIEQSQFVGFAPSSGFSIQSVSPTVDPQAVKFRFYLGKISNTYNVGFADITPSQMVAGFTVPPLTAGSLNVGTGGLSRVFCYDLVLKAWTIIDLPSAISVLKQVRAVGTTPITITGGFNDGTVRRIQAGDLTFDGTPVAWSVRSAEVFGKEANERGYYRRLSIRGVTTQTTLTVNASTNVDGADAASTTPMKVYIQGGTSSGQNEFLAQLDLNYNAFNTHVTLSGTGQAEIHALDWEVVPMAAGVAAVVP